MKSIFILAAGLCSAFCYAETQPEVAQVNQEHQESKESKDVAESAEKKTDTGSHRLFIVPGLGFNQQRYAQTRLNSFTQYSLGPTLFVAYRLRPNIELTLNTFGTGYVIKSVTDAGDTSDVSARFFDLQGGAQFLVPLQASRFHLKAVAGYLFKTSTFSASKMGYKNLTAPLLYPYATFDVFPKHELFGYASFAPINNGFGFLGFDSRQITAAFGWKGSVFGKQLSSELKYTNLLLSILTSRVKTSSVTLSVSYWLGLLP